MVSKGSTALGILHEYDQECEILKALLAQRVWRRGKRGAWYDRLALVLMNHYGGDEEKKREAVEVCLDGLEDADTHLSELILRCFGNPRLPAPSLQSIVHGCRVV